MRLISKSFFIPLIVVFLAITIFPLVESDAQEKVVTAKSIGFEETTIIEFTNMDPKSEVNTIRIWLGSDTNFKSFKTEKGWTGQKTTQGVIIFETSNSLKSGDSVKFGVKTDKQKPGINWKALDDDKQMAIGKTLVSEDTSFQPDGQLETKQNGGGVLENSSFRIIPEKPNVGSSMRITGENFSPNQKLDLYIDQTKLESFTTNEDGGFMITSSIPETKSAGRVTFLVKDSANNEKTISLRIGEDETRVSTQQNVPLTISSIEGVFYRGQEVKFTGTASPGGTVTATIKDTEGKIITTIAVDVDTKGTWSYEGIVNPDTPFGKQTAEITDGTNTITKEWTIKSSKVIELIPLKAIFEPGQDVILNGTAIPNKELEIVVEDPQGTEFHDEVVQVGSSGEVTIKFPTEQSSTEGTYIVFAKQGDALEIFLVGVGELAEEQLILKLDELNYPSGGKAQLELQGPPSATVSLLIIDPSEKQKLTETINLQPDGTAEYELDLQGFSSGVYTAVVSRANSHTDEVFSVGLQTGSGEINARTTKDVYQPGETILILGNSGENILLVLTLLDPDGNEVNTKDTFTNNDGVFSDDSFRIPPDAKMGVWKINAKSGPNFVLTEFEVFGDADEGLVLVAVVDETYPSHLGKAIKISGAGAAETQNISIEIFSPDGDEVTSNFQVVSTKEGIFSTTFPFPSDSIPGEYTIKVKDAFNDAETTFVLE